MQRPERIYLDNAATSWPKPTPVCDAVDRYLRHSGAPAGRSAYAEADDVARQVWATRRSLARLLEIDDPRQVVFAFNGTDSLAMALHGLLRPGEHAITSVVEHNSVLRPLTHWQQRHQGRVTRIGCDALGTIRMEELEAALNSGPTRLVVLSHASNVTGSIQPIAAAARLAHQYGALLLVDAAQSLGHGRCHLVQEGADLIAASGHKGLLGPLGTGLLYLRPGLEQQMECLRSGGTGSKSELDTQPEFLPDKFEAGNLNVPGLLGLGAALDWLEAQGLEALHEQQLHLTARLIDGLAALPQVTVYGHHGTSSRLGVVSVSLVGLDPQEAAAALESAYRIQVRSGLHCAPRMHQALGTDRLGGTLRISLGPFNTIEQIEQLLIALAELAATAGDF